jgi:hypothetical protein
MPISPEATKYQTEFVKAAQDLAQKVASTQYKNDLELIKVINKGMQDLASVRSKHVKHD